MGAGAGTGARAGTGAGAGTGANEAAGARIELVGETAFVYCDDPAPLVADAEAAGLRCVQRRANLEDVFLKLTGRELRD